MNSGAVIIDVDLILSVGSAKYLLVTIQTVLIFPPTSIFHFFFFDSNLTEPTSGWV